MRFSRIALTIGAGIALLLDLSEGTAQTWVPSDTVRRVRVGLASSGDAQSLMAAAYSSQGLTLYSSTNWGSTWTTNGSSNIEAVHMACSADGKSLVLLEFVYGDFLPPNINATYASTNGGVSWRRLGLPSECWFSVVACSADGNCLAALARRDDFGYPPALFISHDFGLSWAITNQAIAWTGIAISGDGSRMAASSETSIYTSADSGRNWKITSAPPHPWISTACSADGSRIVAVAFDGYVCCSTNYGTNWSCTSIANSLWMVSCSAEAKTLLATRYGEGPFYVSTDGGLTWKPADVPSSSWHLVTSSADGSKLAASGNLGIYTFETTPKPILNTTRSHGDLVLSWIVPSMPFALQENSSLAEADWKDVGIQPTLNYTNLQHEVKVSFGASKKFFRLKLR